MLDFDDDAEYPGRLSIDPQGGHHVADAAQLIPIGIEDAEAGKPGDENAGRRAHARSLVGRTLTMLVRRALPARCLQSATRGRLIDCESGYRWLSPSGQRWHRRASD